MPAGAKPSIEFKIIIRDRHGRVRRETGWTGAAG